MKKKIIITGGDGRFAKVLKVKNKKLNIFYPNKKELNILNVNSIRKYINKIKPKYLIHAAALSRPMNIHNKKISKSIDLNIIGTCNIVKVCSELKVKVIYFSTGYVYEGKVGNYKENNPVFPINNYAWSKLGGECAVAMYKDSLILRITMCEKPFVHKKAFYDIKSNFIFHEDVAKIIPKILNKKGILNVGGKIQSIYSFAKKNNKNVKKTSGKKLFPKNPSMNISKLNKIMKW
ncbi:MAG: NAD-dependent epimerase/dehydratase family protein [Candidatus Pelagibacter sp. TMED106]|jgi:dTDP-4-dehydrorhamnose reductase|nr:MAG: NAD-dependent epimerase/dehydratase family protein [Candidatus Pelagibacter sp. TMED106]|tara:strand:- start:37 stop:738 length:702 start_codon:yes stop_codon:yes gene_type:complete